MLHSEIFTPKAILEPLDEITIHPAPVCSNSPLDQDSVSTREAGTQLAKVSSNNVLAADNLGSIGVQKEVGEIGESILQKILGFWYDFILHVTLRVCWDCCLVKCLDQQIHSQSTIELPYFNGVDMVSGQDLPVWIQTKNKRICPPHINLTYQISYWVKLLAWWLWTTWFFNGSTGCVINTLGPFFSWCLSSERCNDWNTLSTSSRDKTNIVKNIKPNISIYSYMFSTAWNPTDTTERLIPSFKHTLKVKTRRTLANVIEGCQEARNSVWMYHSIGRRAVLSYTKQTSSMHLARSYTCKWYLGLCRYVSTLKTRISLYLIIEVLYTIKHPYACMPGAPGMYLHTNTLQPNTYEKIWFIDYSFLQPFYFQASFVVPKGCGRRSNKHPPMSSTPVQLSWRELLQGWFQANDGERAPATSADATIGTLRPSQVKNRISQSQKSFWQPGWSLVKHLPLSRKLNEISWQPQHKSNYASNHWVPSSNSSPNPAENKVRQDSEE